MDPAAIPDYQVLRPGLAVGGQPTAEALGRLKRQGFRTVIDLSLQGQGLADEEALEEGRKAGLKSEEMVEAVRRVVANLRGDLAPCLGCADQLPRMIQNARPEYPHDAFLKNIQGIVEFDVLIDGTGRVVHARLIKSIPLLDSAARRCVLQWKFSPGTRRGHPVVVRGNAPVAFRIYDEGSRPATPPKKQ
jgi:TonB family protein